VVGMERQRGAAECIVCQRRRDSGIWVLGMLICSQCEEKLVESKAADSGYDIYVDRLRVIWQHVFDAEAGASAKLMEGLWRQLNV